MSLHYSKLHFSHQPRGHSERQPTSPTHQLGSTNKVVPLLLSHLFILQLRYNLLQQGKRYKFLNRICICIYLSFCSGYHNEIQQAPWLKWQKCIFSPFWRPEILDQGAGWFGDEGSVSDLQSTTFFLCVHMVFPCAMHAESRRERKRGRETDRETEIERQSECTNSAVSFYKDANLMGLGIYSLI